MRRDLYDMNPGKGMAQAAHAANDFQTNMTGNMVIKNTLKDDYPDWAKKVEEQYAEWVEDRNFGTTIVLEATLEQIKDIEYKAKIRGVPVGIVTDPTYPYRNYYGEVFTAKEVTCGWLFFERGTVPDIDSLLDELKLHR